MAERAPVTECPLQSSSGRVQRPPRPVFQYLTSCHSSVLIGSGPRSTSITFLVYGYFCCFLPKSSFSFSPPNSIYSFLVFQRLFMFSVKLSLTSDVLHFDAASVQCCHLAACSATIEPPPLRVISAPQASVSGSIADRASACLSAGPADRPGVGSPMSADC